jgi:hypothetical protein
MLDRTVLGNTILDWAIAAGAALVVGITLIVVRRLGLRWINARNAKAHSQRDGWGSGVFEGTRPWFLIAVALFFGAQLVDLPPKADGWSTISRLLR